MCLYSHWPLQILQHFLWVIMKESIFPYKWATRCLHKYCSHVCQYYEKLQPRDMAQFIVDTLYMYTCDNHYVGVTFDLSVYWHQYPWQLGEFSCKLRAFISEMSQYCSVLTILSFSCERYLAICHPLYSYTMSGIRNREYLYREPWGQNYKWFLNSQKILNQAPNI